MGDVVKFPVRRAPLAPGITSRQRHALRFIRDYQRTRGQWPTFDEIAAEIGLRSRGGAVRTVNALFEAGALSRPDHPNR